MTYSNPTRRGFITTSLCSPFLVSAAAAQDRPNVIVIVLDDLGCHDLGYLGAADLKTPNDSSHLRTPEASGSRRVSLV
jgi:hypothetical protein